MTFATRRTYYSTSFATVHCARGDRICRTSASRSGAVCTPKNHREALFDPSSVLDRSRHEVGGPSLLLHSRPSGRVGGYLLIHIQNCGFAGIRRLRSCCGATASKPPRRRCRLGDYANLEGGAVQPRDRLMESSVWKPTHSDLVRSQRQAQSCFPLSE